MIKAKYTRPGEFLHGIPARDLTERDWKALTTPQKRAVVDSPLYEIVEKPIKKRAKKSTVVG